MEHECESHARAGESVPAVGHTADPSYRGYWLCQDCIDDYDRQYREHERYSLDCQALKEQIERDR